MNERATLTLELYGESRQCLFALGTNHSFDSTDSQFQTIKEIWEIFIEKTKKTERVALVEVKNVLPGDTFGESISMKGEAGAVAWLARRDGGTMHCPEPNGKDIRKKLCDIFNAHEVAYAMVVQNIAGWYESAKTMTFQDALAHTLTIESRYKDIYSFLLDSKWFVSQHMKLFGSKPFEDKIFLKSISDPRKDDTVVNKVITLKTSFRNEYILRDCKRIWKSGASIFMVYGKGHVLALSDNLHSLVLGEHHH